MSWGWVTSDNIKLLVTAASILFGVAGFGAAYGVSQSERSYTVQNIDQKVSRLQDSFGAYTEKTNRDIAELKRENGINRSELIKIANDTEWIKQTLQNELNKR